MRNQKIYIYIYKTIPSAHKNVGEDETILNDGWSVKLVDDFGEQFVNTL